MIIYKITNKINGKIYIGQTTQSLNVRWVQHCNISSGCVALRSAIEKYGKENFTVEQIDIACDREELDKKEGYWIGYYNSLVPNGYNLTTGGEHPTVTDEVRKRMSENRPDVRGEKNPFYGKHHSEEVRRKQSERMRNVTGENHPNWGKHWSDEQKCKMSDKLKSYYLNGGKHPFLGKNHSKETKLKIKLNHADMCGGKSPRAKKVMCVETGEIFEAISVAAQVKSVCKDKISAVCRGVRKTCGGYHWKYVKEIK